MIDLVYVIGKGSRWHNNELRYSLRSIEKHLTNYRDIWIVGDLPDFIQGVNHIPAKDFQPTPGDNIRQKLLKACRNTDISDTFLFFNDDHYLLSDFDAVEFPDFYCSTIREALRNRAMDSYGVRMQNTLKLLDSHSLPVKYFDVHYPMLFNKKLFIETCGTLEPKKDWYILKSLYANTLKIEGKEVRDCKSKDAPLEKALCFSTLPRIVEGTQLWFEKKFPNKSRFEI